MITITRSVNLFRVVPYPPIPSGFSEKDAPISTRPAARSAHACGIAKGIPRHLLACRSFARQSARFLFTRSSPLNESDRSPRKARVPPVAVGYTLFLSPSLPLCSPLNTCCEIFFYLSTYIQESNRPSRNRQ